MKKLSAQKVELIDADGFVSASIDDYHEETKANLKQEWDETKDEQVNMDLIASAKEYLEGEDGKGKATSMEGDIVIKDEPVDGT